MKDNKEKYLPIGSVVLLTGGTKRVMITGYFSLEDANPEIIYDYNGCIYPEGYLSSDQTCLFNHSQIDTIDFIGFEDSEQKEFSIKLIELEKSIKELPTDVESIE